MQSRAFFGAVVGALVGAGIWAAIAALTGYEVGFVAWGIGLVVGFGAAAMGGQGEISGVVCAVLALASIFLGKMLAVHFSMPSGSELRRMVEAQLTEETYEELMGDAADFAELESPKEYRRFMASHGFSKSEKANRVTPQELATFVEHTAPMLQRLHEKRPDYETWREEQLGDMVPDISLFNVAVESLGAMDILFAILGLASAFKVGAGMSSND